MGLLKDIENATHLLLTEELVAPLGQVNMSSYAAPVNAKDDSPRHITWGSNGAINAQLDSIQSQNNRIEPIFASFPELVPATEVVYPNGTKMLLLDEPHRSAAPLIRYHFTDELLALKANNPEPLARRNPTAFIFGLDVRTEWVKLARLITGVVIARNVVPRPAGSSLSSRLDAETRKQLVDLTKMKASEIGVDQVCTFTEKSGTVDTTDATITRRVELPLSVLDQYKPVLRDYLKGLALVALLYPVPLNLRSGTSLVRRSRTLEVFSDFDLSSRPITLDGAFEEALAFARSAAAAFGIGRPETLTVDTDKVTAAAMKQKEHKADKAARKSKETKGASA